MLIISDWNKYEIQWVVYFATLKDNWYIPGQSDISVNSQQHSYISDESTSCMFHWVYVPTEDRLFRHLGMRGRKPKTIPAAHIWQTLASWFGFTGGTTNPADRDLIAKPGPDWVIYNNPSDSTIVVVQPIDWKDVPWARNPITM